MNSLHWPRNLSDLAVLRRRLARPLPLLLLIAVAVMAVAGGGLSFGWHWLTLLATLLGLCLGGFALGNIRAKGESAQEATMRDRVADAVIGPRERSDTSQLVDEMLAQGRYALLLRPQVVGNLSALQQQRANACLQSEMTVVPAGELLVGIAEDDLAQEIGEAFESGFAPTIMQVDELLLDRYAVTNRQYLEFVRAGGYKQLALWDPAAWPAVSSFVDTTNQLGPRFWKHGSYPAGLAEHPVVGVSWYEACAYARWVGKRLPSDAEWEKAASWPLPLGDAGPRQRRFPWGDSMANGRANIWTAGREGTSPVDDFSAGCSAGGAYQLTGNVWEWTADDLADARVSLLFPMKSIRGGAYDTYFENQATCQFRSAETPVNRKHNIGFRCALGACDLHPTVDRGERQTDEPSADLHEEPVCV